MSKIEINNLTFGYDNQGTQLFNNVDLLIDTNWKLGLVGRNGRGKTTLMKLLQDKLPYQGKISHQEKFLYFPQQISNKNELAISIIQELSNSEQWKIEREIRRLSMDPTILWRTYASLSGGEQTKLLLAVLFAEEGKFVLIDEPTNHLDQDSRLQAANYLKGKQQGFILTSHDRAFMDQVVDHILAIEKTKIDCYQGSYSSYEMQQELKNLTEIKQNNKLKKDVKRLKTTAEEKAKWSHSRENDKHGKPSQKNSGSINDKGFIGARAARTMKRAKTINTRMNHQIEEKEKLVKNVEYVEKLTMCNVSSRHKRILEVEELQLSYEYKNLFQPISFELHIGERIILTGKNGSGKTSIIRAINGTYQGQMTGEIIFPKSLSISYVRQNYEDNTGTLLEFSQKVGLNYQIFLTNLHKLGLERRAFQTTIEKMSMGQRKKVEVAKSLSQPAVLYIWDEPLNYLDSFNQKQLEELILIERPTMLIVDHETKFLETIGAPKIVLNSD